MGGSVLWTRNATREGRRRQFKRLGDRGLRDRPRIHRRCGSNLLSPSHCPGGIEVNNVLRPEINPSSSVLKVTDLDAESVQLTPGNIGNKETMGLREPLFNPEALGIQESEPSNLRTLLEDKIERRLPGRIHRPPEVQPNDRVLPRATQNRVVRIMMLGRHVRDGLPNTRIMDGRAWRTRMENTGDLGDDLPERPSPKRFSENPAGPVSEPSPTLTQSNGQSRRRRPLRARR